MEKTNSTEQPNNYPEDKNKRGGGRIYGKPLDVFILLAPLIPLEVLLLTGLKNLFLTGLKINRLFLLKLIPSTWG